nr:hypothetical protein Iba_chr15dCG0760 [Ipomoea batatas]
MCFLSILETTEQMKMHSRYCARETEAMESWFLLFQRKARPSFHSRIPHRSKNFWSLL